ISLDVTKRNGINISPNGYFGSFVPERLFQTEDQAFHLRKGSAVGTAEGRVSPDRSGIPVQFGATGHQVEEKLK
ncbi:hypothetical protein, partial [Mesorhizobium sp. M2E.F.Ca.ET.166.01.1.1]|uniref:hypothetical protein n=1 Tax=Mesorhizobium sp. M2E.F.Ca.ET.166.01.1.1 TaxID=2500523 RepID=UPI001AEE25F8